MKVLFRFISKHIGYFITLKWLIREESPHFLPFYHVVSNEKLPHILNYPYRNLYQFEQELDIFLKYFHPVSLEELARGTCHTKKIIHLSFDDGLRECFENVVPLLKKKGIPATFFVNTAFIDNQGLFHKYKASLILNRIRINPNPGVEKFLAANSLGKEKILTASASQSEILNEAASLLGINFAEFLALQKPYLTSEQIKKVANQGFTIGAHSHSHSEFWNLPEKEQLNEVKESMTRIVKLADPSIRAFSFPFTDSGVPASVLKAIKNEDICDITFGTAGIKWDSFDFHYQRFPVEQTGDFISNLKAEFIYLKLRKWMGKAKVKH